MEDPKRLISSLNPLLLIVISVISFGALIAVISVCTTKLKNRLPERLVKTIDNLKARFMFNVFIASLQTSYQNLWISAHIKIKQTIKDFIQFTGEQTHRKLSEEEPETEPIQKITLAMNTLLSICLASGLIAALVLITRLIKRNPVEYFKLEDTRAKFGALYKDYTISSKPALFYSTFYLARRFFVAVVFVFVETIAIKVELIVLSCFAALIYLI